MGRVTFGTRRNSSSGCADKLRGFGPRRSWWLNAVVARELPASATDHAAVPSRAVPGFRVESLLTDRAAIATLSANRTVATVLTNLFPERATERVNRVAEAGLSRVREHSLQLRGRAGQSDAFRSFQSRSSRFMRATKRG